MIIWFSCVLFYLCDAAFLNEQQDKSVRMGGVGGKNHHCMIDFYSYCIMRS